MLQATAGFLLPQTRTRNPSIPSSERCSVCHSSSGESAQGSSVEQNPAVLRPEASATIVTISVSPCPKVQVSRVIWSGKSEECGGSPVHFLNINHTTFQKAWIICIHSVKMSTDPQALFMQSRRMFGHFQMAFLHPMQSSLMLLTFDNALIIVLIAQDFFLHQLTGEACLTPFHKSLHLQILPIMKIK